MKVDAKTYWVWTDKAEAADPNRVAGSPLPPVYKGQAPIELIERGYIIDNSEYTGQVDLYAALEGEVQDG